MTDLTKEQLKAQAEQIQKQLKAIRKTELVVAFEAIKALVGQHKMTKEELVDGVFPPVTRPAKYVDPVTGATWSGCGVEPKWITAAGGREKCVIGAAVAQAALDLTEKSAAEESAAA